LHDLYCTPAAAVAMAHHRRMCAAPAGEAEINNAVRQVCCEINSQVTPAGNA
jgi:hypothetical protein